MKKKPTKETPPSVEDINSIYRRHVFAEYGAIVTAFDENGNVYIAATLDSLIRKIRDNDPAIKTGCSKAAIEDQKRLDFLNVMFSSFESGFTSGQSPFIASAVGGAFKNVRDAIDSLASETKRIEVVPYEPETQG